MSDIKEELNYYKADEFLDKYIKGEMNIHNSIQLKNRTQTTIYHVSFLHHLLYLCKTTKTNIPALNFLRNIVTKGIKLNALVGKKFFIGKVEVKGHDLCRPCKNLQDSFQQKNTIKELLNTGGLRCEILNTGRIQVGDLIKE